MRYLYTSILTTAASFSGWVVVYLTKNLPFSSSPYPAPAQGNRRPRDQRPAIASAAERVATRYKSLPVADDTQVAGELTVAISKHCASYQPVYQ